MDKSTEPAVGNFGSFLSLGSLLIVVGVLSYGIHRLYGEWPVGFNGRIGALFLVSGVVFLGISMVVQFRDRRAGRENANLGR